MDDLYKNCRLCPRDCGVDRQAGAGGFCGESSQLRLAFAGLHFGEEPPLSGKNGSGAIFVSGCNLRCVICQNWQISGGGADTNKNGGGENLGRAVSAGEFAAICLALQKKGAENINIVTGSHSVPAIVQGLQSAKKDGLRIPVLWNSSAYESVETLELLDGYIAVWLPDLKTLDSALAEKLFNAPDYPQIAAKAISWMINNRPGRVIVRHLILPGQLESTRAVLRWFADVVGVENAADNAQLSLMSQYTPIAGNGKKKREKRKEKEGLYGILDGQTIGEIQPPGRFLSQREYNTVLGWLEEFAIEDGFCQELLTGSDWLPDFRRPNPFSSKLSVPVWHY